MNGRVLIVDDEEDIITVLKHRFEANNYEVFSAVDGEECIEKTLKHNPQVIIMDVIMAKMSGGDAARKLGTLQETRDIPIVFLTALAAYLPDHGYEKNINIDGKFFPAYAKPFDSRELVLAVKKLMRNQTKEGFGEN